MAIVMIGDDQVVYPPNPKMQGEDWAKEYPPIQSKARWLINKFTGDIVPNHEEFAARSDIYEPFLGDPRNRSTHDVEAVASDVGDLAAL